MTVIKSFHDDWIRCWRWRDLEGSSPSVFDFYLSGYARYLPERQTLRRLFDHVSWIFSLYPLLLINFGQARGIFGHDLLHDLDTFIAGGAQMRPISDFEEWIGERVVNAGTSFKRNWPWAGTSISISGYLMVLFNPLTASTFGTVLKTRKKYFKIKS